MEKTAFLLLSSQCNKACSYCFNKQAPFNKQRKDLIKTCATGKITEILLSLNVKEVILTGGEPLMLGNKLVSLIRKLSDNGIACSLDTNGTLLTSCLAKDLLLAGLKNVYLSTRYFKAIDSAIVEYLKNKFNLSLIHVFSNKDYMNLPKVINNYKSIVNNVIAQPVWHGSAQGDSCISELSVAEWIKLEAILSSLFPVYRNNIDYMRAAYKRKGKIPKSCRMVKKNFVIYNDGEVYRCFHRQDLKIGNIFKDSVALINENLMRTANDVSDVNCFGSHCFSLFL